ncbi:Zinc finger and BTB domain-containing protein 8A, partial [Stegodyphus mimosarum]
MLITRFKCQQCDYITLRKDTLMRHQRAHLEERPHKCPYCLKSFKRKDYLGAHFRKCHLDAHK